MYENVLFGINWKKKTTWHQFKKHKAELQVNKNYLAE